MQLIPFREFRSSALCEAILNEVQIQFNKNRDTKFGNVVILAGGAGCHAKGEAVLMYNGEYKRVEDVEVGDLLMGTDSTPRTVQALHNGVEKMLLTETKNDSYITNMSHIHSFVASYDKCGLKQNQIYDMTYVEYQALKPTARKALKLYKNSKELEFENSVQPQFNPWLVGLWLADGTVDTPNITIDSRSPLVDFIPTILDDSYIFSKIVSSQKENCAAYSITTNGAGTNPFRDYVKTLTVNGSRRIPKDLLTGTVNDRKALLAGLIDGDGHNGNNTYEIVTKYPLLSEDIKYLCGSLGLQVNVVDKFVQWRDEPQKRQYKRISISGDLSTYPIVLDYKKYTGTPNKVPTRFAPKFTILEAAEYFGFELDGDRRYILQNWFVTHNSGKGFTLTNLVGIEGKVFDVDELKKLAQKAPGIVDKVKREYGTDITDGEFDLRDPANVGELHNIIGDGKHAKKAGLNLDSKKENAFFKSVAQTDKSRLPNIIFDVTLKDMKKFHEIHAVLEGLGYELKKRHIVWIVNDVEVAKSQNLSRDRVVPEEILIKTHQGANETMKTIIEMGSSLRQYIDGDIFFTFGKKDIDTLYMAGQSKASGVMNRKKVSPGYLKDAEYIQLKEVGKAPKSTSSISAELRRKIDAYTPDDENNTWA